jgi:homoserine trans-succinylase
VIKESKAEIQKRKMEDKAAQSAQKAIHVEVKRMIAGHDKGFQEQMAEQSRKHAAQLDALKQSQMATQHLVAQKAPSQVYNYKVAAHFEYMTKASETLFDGKTENVPTFETHIIREAENPTVGWSKDILRFKVVGQYPEINFLESYFDIP